MKQSTSRECDDQADIRLSWNPQVHHFTYNSPKQETYPTSNGFNPHGHTPISTISLVHMATPHDRFSPYGHTPVSTINSALMATFLSISTINPVHMATFLCPQSIQSTWPHSYIYDQLSPHGHILTSTVKSVHMAIFLSISTINPVHMATFLRPQSIRSTWPHSYIYDQSSPHGHNPISTINPVYMATFLCPRSIQSTFSTLLSPQSKYCSSIYI